MALAAAKRLIMEHENLKRGQFNQFRWNRMLAGGVCEIFGFGGIGAATAHLMYGIGMRVHAIQPAWPDGSRVELIGTPERLNDLVGGDRPISLLPGYSFPVMPKSFLLFLTGNIAKKPYGCCIK